MALFDNLGEGIQPSNFNSANGISSPGTSFMGFFNGNNAANRRQFEQQKFNATQAAIGRNFNANQAKINRDYQTDMSNTAVQRRMADMKKGGINPILAGGYAASQPSGSSASGSGATASLGNGNAGFNKTIEPIIRLFTSAAKLAGRK